MARPEVTGRKVVADAALAAAFTIAEFCRAHRRLISQEAAAEWRKAREAAA